MRRKEEGLDETREGLQQMTRRKVGLEEMRRKGEK